MVREQYSALRNKTGKMLPFSFHHRNRLLILLVHWLLQKPDKDARKKQERKAVKLIKIICIFFVKILQLRLWKRSLFDVFNFVVIYQQ